MSLPIILSAGTIAVYGWGYQQGQSGIVPNDIVFRFSTVYQIWDGGGANVNVGEQVMWKEGSEVCKLAYLGNPYTILPCRLVTKEILPP